MPTPVRDFLEHNFLHYNARELVAAARAYEQHLDAGGKMMVTLAGAMSTAQLGKTLARMIREDKVHAITCTGANLEEDLFNLFAGTEYEPIPNWRALSAEDEQALYDRGMNRVTDTCIPETVMRQIEAPLREAWKRAAQNGERYFPHEFMQQIVADGQLAEHYVRPAEESWLLAAFEKNIPITTPGWEDSTLGNMFTACVIMGELPDHTCIKLGTEAMQELCNWYKQQTTQASSLKPQAPVGFFQIGGGIAGDFPICAVPLMIQDLKWKDTPFWGYFCQITDAVTSYGGYSGAVPNEKITWGKLEVDTPKFMIESDATIVAPLIFAWVLGE
ncbi:MAG: deoxyhypusine synthase family protein [Planctomycetota bacterium]